MNLESKKQAKFWLQRQKFRGRGYRPAQVLLACLDTCLGLGIAIVLARCLAGALTGQMLYVTGLITAFLMIAAIRVGLNFIREEVAARCGAAACESLRRDIMSVMEAEGPRLLRQHHSAEIATMIVDQVDAMEGYFSRFLPIKATWLITPTIVLLAVAHYSRESAGILLASALIAIVAQAVFGIWTGVEAKKQFQAMLRLQTRFLDRVRGIATLVVSGAIAHEAENLQIAGDTLRRKTMRVLRTAFLSSTATDFAAVAAMVGLAVAHFRTVGLLAHTEFHAGNEPLFAIFFAFLCVPEFYAGFRAKGAAYQDAAQAEAAAATLYRLFSDAQDVPNAGADGPHTVQMSADLTLEFEQVVFSWKGSARRAVDGLSFTAATDDIVVLDGPSGAGKSTVMELILGFVKPQEGRISFNGVDAMHLGAGARAKLMAWIDQQPTIFAGSLRENILFGNQAASEDALQDAVDNAGLDEVVRQLPDGLNTMMGEGGYGLSGGQVQRVAIARAFIKDAPLLLLDEPTAHLDPESERTVIKAIRRLAHGRTVVLSSHAPEVRALATKTISLRKAPSSIPGSAGGGMYDA